jgi:hypothetical protein
MYDRATTAAAVAAASVTIPNTKFIDRPLVYHDQSQIDAAIDHYNNLWDPDAQRLTRALTPDEQWFITNERTLCALDFRGYWLPNYAWIIDWRKQPRRFVANVAQQIVMDLWAEDEAAGNAILMQQLKARRLGVSTISELNVTHRYQFTPYSNCVVASADPDKSVEMAGMMKYALDAQPWWLLPRVTKIKKAIPVEFGDQHCTLQIEAGNQFTGVARGAAPNIFHLSELCEWQDAEDIVDGALLRAVLDDPGVFGILESTALGIGNWWHRTWLQNKRDFQRGTARVRPIFLPWYVGTDIYPTPAWLRKTPVPAGWIPEERTIRHAERAREYVLANPLLFKYLAGGNANWQMPREQMWYREVEYRTAQEKKQLHIFLAEMCADDMEAFQSSNVPLIDQEILLGYHERTRHPVGVYTIVGPDIPPLLVAPARDWDTSKPTITIDTKELTPRHAVKYQLIPLKFTGYDALDEQLKLLIWEWPEFPYVYGVGVDCSEGVGQDNAVIEVLRDAVPNRESGQVAEWAANTVTAFQLWPLVHAVGCLYSTVSPTAGERRQCELDIETWANGAACQYELQKRGWSNFHSMYYAGDSKVIKRVADVRRIGVITNQTLRASIQDFWMTCLKEEAIDIPSPYLVQEISTLENVNGKAQAALGSFDDRWMGLGFPLYSRHRNKPPSQQYTRRRVSYVPGLEEDQPIAHPTWKAPAQASSTPFRPQHQQIFRNRGRGALGRLSNPDVPIRYR